MADGPAECIVFRFPGNDVRGEILPAPSARGSRSQPDTMVCHAIMRTSKRGRRFSSDHQASGAR